MSQNPSFPSCSSKGRPDKNGCLMLGSVQGRLNVALWVELSRLGSKRVRVPQSRSPGPPP